MKVSYFGRKLEQNGSSWKSLLNWRKIHRIILDKYVVHQDLDEYEDHCLNLKHAPYEFISYAVYKTLVNEKIWLVLRQIRHMTFQICGVSISRLHQDNPRYWRTCAAWRLKVRRILWRCTNIPEYYNLEPHTRLLRRIQSSIQPCWQKV